tara:strand:+ start:22 stop:582 length:561 start_codon:yes stop_codon:yes gene_type:complete
MEKTSKVISVQANGSWKGNYGEMFKFELAFENGDSGEYSSKSPDQQKFIQGKEATYTIDTSNPKYPKIKPVFVQNSGGFKGGYKENPERQRMIVKQSSLKVALDFMIAKKPKSLYVDDVFKVADKMVDWVMEKPQNGASLETQLKHTPQEPVAKPKSKKSNMDDIVNFAEQSGQTAFPSQDEDLPF